MTVCCVHCTLYKQCNQLYKMKWASESFEILSKMLKYSFAQSVNEISRSSLWLLYAIAYIHLTHRIYFILHCFTLLHFTSNYLFTNIPFQTTARHPLYFIGLLLRVVCYSQEKNKYKKLVCCFCVSFLHICMHAWSRLSQHRQPLNTHIHIFKKTIRAKLT